MTLHKPFKISSRLMPAIEIGGATLSLNYGRYDREDRMVYDIWIDLPDGQELHIDDLRSGVGGGDLISGFGSLCSFLSAAAEARQYREHVQRRDFDPDDNSNEALFVAAIVDWASTCSDEISIMGMEIEERPELIEEGAG
jgi:hypothetical protein